MGSGALRCSSFGIFTSKSYNKQKTEALVNMKRGSSLMRSAVSSGFEGSISSFLSSDGGNGSGLTQLNHALECSIAGNTRHLRASNKVKDFVCGRRSLVKGWRPKLETIHHFNQQGFSRRRANSASPNFADACTLKPQPAAITCITVNELGRRLVSKA